MPRLRFSLRALLLVTLLSAATARYWQMRKYQLEQFENWSTERGHIIQWLQSEIPELQNAGKPGAAATIKGVIIDRVDEIGEPPYDFPRRWIPSDLREMKLSQQEVELRRIHEEQQRKDGSRLSSRN